MSIYCGDCGAELTADMQFCPNCGKKNENVKPIKKNRNHKKMIIAGALLTVMIVCIVVGVANRTVNEPCDWCNHRPSYAFKTSDGSMAYVCKDCKSNCAWCSKKATKHYENLLGMIVFVCDDCYDDIVND